MEFKKNDHKLFDYLKFVIEAKYKSSNTRMPAIQYLFIQEDIAVATNGKVLHWIQHNYVHEIGDSVEDKQPNGTLFEVLKNTQSRSIIEPVISDSNFPAWQTVIPQHETFFVQHTDTFHLLAADLGSVGVFTNQFFFEGFKYLDTELKVFFGKPGELVYIQSADDGAACNAVIMPVEEHNKPKIEICDADLEI